MCRPPCPQGVYVKPLHTIQISYSSVVTPQTMRPSIDLGVRDVDGPRLRGCRLRGCHGEDQRYEPGEGCCGEGVGVPALAGAVLTARRPGRHAGSSLCGQGVDGDDDVPLPVLRHHPGIVRRRGEPAPGDELQTTDNGTATCCWWADVPLGDDGHRGARRHRDRSPGRARRPGCPMPGPR